MEILAALAFGVGTVLFLTSASRIFKHDDGSTAVMVRCASGFVLLLFVGVVGVFSL